MDMFFSDDDEVRLMGGQAEHDQISISTVETMSSVRIIVGLQSGFSNAVHHLMFPFTWH